MLGTENPLSFASLNESPYLSTGGLEPYPLQLGNSLNWAGSSASIQEIAFVDSGLADAHTLVDGLKPGTAVYWLNPSGDTLDQITQVLAGYSNLSAVALFSHGSDGALQLGSSSLNNDNLIDYAGVLQSWSGALSEDADLLFYGCDVAAGNTGQSFVSQIAALTGADVAASTDLTGSSVLGGDWDLEFSTGSIEASEFLSEWAQDAYQGVLATYTVTNTNDSGAGSLRQAIRDSNTNPGADTINFTGSIFTDNDPNIITLTSGELTITDDLTINGDLDGNGTPDLTISGNKLFRIFGIDDGTNTFKTVNLTGLIVTGGFAGTGGGILNTENLSIRDSSISGNWGLSGGGGISSLDGTTSISNSTISGNSARFGGGTLSLGGGTTSISNSTIGGNSASEGGGIYSLDGTTSISNSTISGNSASEGGGGIYNSLDGTTSISNSTVTNNTAPIGKGSGVFSAQDGVTEVISSIIAGNSNSDVDIVLGSSNTFVSGGYNLIGTGNATGNFNQIGDKTDITNPGLAPLANYGGSTQTHTLLPGSPAINAGSTPDGLDFDQRGTGFARVFGGSADIGAFEVQNNFLFLVNNINDSGAGSLRQAILDSNANVGADTIILASDLKGQTITLTSGELTITDDLTINGDLDGNGTPDLTISGNELSRVFKIDDGTNTFKTVDLTGLIVTGGFDSTGGGILNTENLSIRDSSISGNWGLSGGGGISSLDGTTSISNSTISGNSGRSGGGTLSLGGTTSISNSTISGNSASEGGGTYSLDGTTSISNSTISGNSASEGGGGIYNWLDSTTSISNSTVTNNTAPIGKGSGVFSAQDGVTEVISSIIAGNSNSDVDIVLGSSNTFVSGGYNLIGTGNATGNFNQIGDKTDITNPGLAPLADNEGTTQTHALLSDSPAIDAGSNPDNLTTDQRGTGFARVLGDTADIGAFEAPVPVPTVSLTATDITANETTGDTGSYQLTRSNSNDTLTVQLKLSGTTSATDYVLSVNSGGSVKTVDADTIEVTFDAGVSSLALTLNPEDDNLVEADETLTLTLQDGNLYDLGSNNLSGTVTILQNDFTVTNANDSGEGSLRQAILNANANAGADIITFTNAVSGQFITLTSGELMISDDLTIDGDLDDNGSPDIIIDGNEASRIFNIDDGTSQAKTINLTGLILGRGFSTSSGGGIWNTENLSISNSTISNNSTSGFDSNGGGIYSIGNLSVNNSTISDNYTLEDGSEGGGIASIGNLSVSNSTINNNYTSGEGSEGGGIFSLGGLNVSQSTISENSTLGDSSNGGGIWNNANLTGTIAIISNSTLSGNSTRGRGGGIFNTDGLLQLRNSTVTNNTAPDGQGSGIASIGNNLIQTEVVSSIIAGNINSDVDVVFGSTNSFVSLGHNVIGTGNATGNFSQSTDQTGVTDPGLNALGNYGGSTQTHALLSDSSAIDAGSNPDNLTTDQRGTGFARVLGDTADIGAFEAPVPVPNVSLTATDITANETTGDTGSYQLTRSNSNDTLTVQLKLSGTTSATDYTLSVSPEGSVTLVDTDTIEVTFNAGVSSLALTLNPTDDNLAEAAETLILTLQESTSYDLEASSSGTVTILQNGFTVTNANDSGEGSLRQAILNANAIAGADTITFASELSNQTILLTSGELQITDDLTINGDLDGNDTPDLTISGNNDSRVFNIDDGINTTDRTINLIGLAITGGRISENFQNGGGILNRETLRISNSTISGNSTTGNINSSGGGIANFSSLTINNSTISGNSTAGNTSSGGGIANFSSLTINNSTISDNSTTGENGDGGGIYSIGSLSISNSTINDNSVTGDISEGGGLFINSQLTNRIATILNSTISGNSATAIGGGISLEDGLLQLRNTTVTNNSASGGRGSGVASFGDRVTRTEVVSSIISGNSNSDVDFVGSGGFNSFVSLGNNLIGTGNATTFGSNAFNQTGDMTGVTNPGLAELANNGGSTQTHALLSDSRAINTGSNPDGLEFDQRGSGFARILGDGVDIGAFESEFLPNTAPVNTVPGSQTINEDTPLVFSSNNGNAISITDDSTNLTTIISVTDGTGILSATTGGDVSITDNDTRSVTLQGNAAQINAALAGLTYTPTANANSVDYTTLTLKTSDDDLTDTDTVVITVTPVNDAPSFTKGDDEIVLEDSEERTIPSWATNLSPGPTDEAEQLLEFDVATDNDSLFEVLPTLTADGTLNYTLAPNANGSANVTVTLTDDGNASEGNVNASDPQIFMITATPVNDAPSFTKGANLTVNQTAGTQTITGWATNMEAGPTNESNQALSFTVTNNNTALFSVQPTLNVDGVLTYTPNPTLSSTITDRTAIVTVTLLDDGDTANGGQNSFTQTFTISVGGNPNPNNGPDTIIGTDGNDSIDSGNGNDTVSGGAGDDIMLGGNGKDALNGGLGNDSIDGGNGDDAVSGDAGNDTLLGGSGNDVLRGGLGNDVLNGGKSKDTFVLASGEGTDTVQDFKNGEDKIGLTNGLTYDQLTIQLDGNRVKIIVTSTGEVLAYLDAVTLNLIDLTDFVTST